MYRSLFIAIMPFVFCVAAVSKFLAAADESTQKQKVLMMFSRTQLRTVGILQLLSAIAWCLPFVLQVYLPTVHTGLNKCGTEGGYFIFAAAITLFVGTLVYECVIYTHQKIYARVIRNSIAIIPLCFLLFVLFAFSDLCF